MNGRFENIFEKYNITCNVPKKHKRKSKTSIQSYAFEKNQSFSLHGNKYSTKNDSRNFNTSCSGTNTANNLNSSFYLNTSVREKYFCATRYKTLEVIGVQNVPRPLKCSTLQCLSYSENVGECSRKENCIEIDSFFKSRILGTVDNRSDNTSSEIVSKMDLSLIDFNTCDNTENNSNDNKSIKGKINRLSCSFNFARRKHSFKSQVQSQSLRYNKLNVTVIPKTSNNLCSSLEKRLNNKSLSLNHSNNMLNDSYNSLICSPEPSQTIDTPTITQQSIDNTATELDLLIELIEHQKKNKRKLKVSNSNSDILPPTKSCLKGGYEELFERVLKRETVAGNFLKHDRKIGLRTGKLLSLVELKTTYGFTIAVVKSEDLHNNFGVIVAQEMVPQLKSGTQIEAFFDDKTVPYKLQYNKHHLDIYLEPYKLLIV